jgi:hypothetical protein
VRGQTRGQRRRLSARRVVQNWWRARGGDGGPVKGWRQLVDVGPRWLDGGV